MEKEHEWLLIGNRLSNERHDHLRVFTFRCKWCNEEDESFDIEGPPRKRNMMDECKHD